ncbi:hypothetical protein RYX36_023338 [Vicia faba]
MEPNNDQSYVNNPNVQQKDEWSSIEHQSTVPVSSVLMPIQVLTSRQLKNHEDQFVAEDGLVESENHDSVGSASIPAKIISDDNQASASAFDDSLYEDLNSYQSHRHPFDDNEAENGASSVAANLEQLNIHTDDQGTEPEEDNSDVLIPNHLQLHTPECFSLSFGSFGSKQNAAAVSDAGTHASRPLQSNLDEASGANDEHITTTSDGNIAHITGVDARTYEHSSISQPEALKPEPSETAQENQYSFPSSSHEFTYENAQQPDLTSPHKLHHYRTYVQTEASISRIMTITDLIAKHSSGSMFNLRTQTTASMPPTHF